MTYEYLKTLMTPEGGKIGIVNTIIAGGLAGIANWVVGMPPDVLKSRLQSGVYYSSILLDIFYQNCILL